MLVSVTTQISIGVRLETWSSYICACKYLVMIHTLTNVDKNDKKLFKFLQILLRLSSFSILLSIQDYIILDMPSACSHKLVARWGEGFQANSPVQPNRHGGVAFRGRSYRLGTGAAANRPVQSDQQGDAAPVQPNRRGSEVFRGRSYRLNQ